MAASAGIDTQINIYDLQKLELKSRIAPSEYGAYTKVEFSNTHPHLLYAASTLGDFNVIDVRNGSVVKVFKGHQGAINDFKEIKERNIIVTAGDDRQCLVFDLR